MKLPQLYDIFQERWSSFQSIWLVSDTHFDDEELASALNSPERQDSGKQLAAIQEKVGRQDILIHLGDVGNIEYIRKIKGYKILIQGNHDAGASKYKRLHDSMILNKKMFSKAEAIAAMASRHPHWHVDICDYKENKHFWFISADNRLFDEVYEGPLQIGEKLILSHEPLDINWAFNIHGHDHSINAQNDKNHLNICPEARGSFAPVHFNEILKSGKLCRIQSLHDITIQNAGRHSRNPRKKAIKILQCAGILDANGNIIEAYKDIIVKK